MSLWLDTASRVFEANCEKRLWAAVGSGNEWLCIAFPERYSGRGAILKTFTWVSNTTLVGCAGVVRGSICQPPQVHWGKAWEPMWHLKMTMRPLRVTGRQPGLYHRHGSASLLGLLKIRPLSPIRLPEMTRMVCSRHCIPDKSERTGSGIC